MSSKRSLLAVCLTLNGLCTVCTASEVSDAIDFDRDEESERCLLQRARSDGGAVRKGFTSSGQLTTVSAPVELDWTTNIGQKNHHCKGSRFEVDFTGTHNGMVVHNGLLLKKGNCSSTNTSAPVVTKALTCQDQATGCHMWCAPVWQSLTDASNWSAFDARCSGWDGAFDDTDAACAQAGELFTWARATLPTRKNLMELTFAISKSCDQWCAPLWVTLYDPKNWAKTFRWCFNQKGDWGGCDQAENVTLRSWVNRKFEFTKFMQKHGYHPSQYILELATYAESDSAEVLISNGIKLSTVASNNTQLMANNTDQACGVVSKCGADKQCCRKANSETEATCCPKDWSCCEDSCCPSYYTCSITPVGHTCLPPKDEPPMTMPICNL